MEEKRICYIEDNDGNFRLIERLCQRICRELKISIELTRGLTAAEALHLASNHQYDVVILDVQLPDSHETPLEAVVQAFRQHQKKRITIYGFTAKALKGDREAVLNAGCDIYESKPIEDMNSFRDQLLIELGINQSIHINN